MKRIFAFLLITFFYFAVSGQTTDKNISNSGFSDTEPFLAVNPANSNNLIAAWMHMTISLKMAIYTKASFDGGVTWGNQNSLPHISPTFTSADVSITFNNAGTAIISYVDYKSTLDSGYVRTAVSANGGVSWSNPVNAVSSDDASDIPVDRPWIVADQTGGTFSGRLYIVSKSYYAVAPPQKVWLTVSSDTGKTWSPIKQLDDSIPTGLTNIMGTPAVGADGSLYVAYISYKPLISPFVRVICTKSTDGGTSFTRYDAMHYAGNSGNSDTLYQGSYSLSANPANAGNIIYQCTDSRNGDMDVLSVYSTDGGVTWSPTPICVNNDGVGNGFGQDMSWSGFSPNGTYAIAWRDRRNGITNDTSKFEIYTSVSADGGASFGPNYKMSSAQSSFVNLQRGNDFLGIGLDNNSIYTDWCDMRTGNNEIFFRGESLSVVSGVQDQPGEIPDVTVYPNPSSGMVNVQLMAHGAYTSTSSPPSLSIAIYNIFGEKVCEMVNGQWLMTHGASTSTVNPQLLTIDLSAKPKGVYLFKLKNEEGSACVKKIIIF